MTDKTQILSKAVCTAREQLENEKAVSAIDGACHKNALYLAEYLYTETNFDPYIRWGVVDYSNKNHNNLRAAEKEGDVHFWVEIEVSDNNWFIADIFSMRSEKDGLKRGDTVVSQSVDSYEVFPNTLYKYTPEIEPLHLLGQEMDALQNIISPLK